MSLSYWKVMKCTIQLSRSESMNNLDWSTVEDEKDKRIRELEDTLRKQKELMEILQVFVHPTPLYSPPNILFWVFRGKCSWPRMMISQTLFQSQMRFPTSKILSTFRLNNIKGWKASKFWAISCHAKYQRLIFSIDEIGDSWSIVWKAGSEIWTIWKLSPSPLPLPSLYCFEGCLCWSSNHCSAI